MAASKSKCLPLYLDREVYARLEEEARGQERVAEQQAAWILRQHLGLAVQKAPSVPGRGDDAA
jgi:hypothetical protein